MRDDKEMITNPNRWPYPVLPMKRYQDATEPFPELGILLATEPTKIHLTDLFNLDLEDCPFYAYNSIDDLLADGWKVD